MSRNKQRKNQIRRQKRAKFMPSLENFATKTKKGWLPMETHRHSISLSLATQLKKNENGKYSIYNISKKLKNCSPGRIGDNSRHLKQNGTHVYESLIKKPLFQKQFEFGTILTCHVNDIVFSDGNDDFSDAFETGEMDDVEFTFRVDFYCEEDAHHYILVDGTIEVCSDKAMTCLNEKFVQLNEKIAKLEKEKPNMYEAEVRRIQEQKDAIKEVIDFFADTMLGNGEFNEKLNKIAEKRKEALVK